LAKQIRMHGGLGDVPVYGAAPWKEKGKREESCSYEKNRKKKAIEHISAK